MNIFNHEAAFADARKRMVWEQLSEFPPEVRAAVERVPRHQFVSPENQFRAYDDRALPIGFGQTISQPWIAALMTTQLHPQPADRILEIGTGTGYQAAVLSHLVAEIFTIEIVEPLVRRAMENFRRLGIRNVCLHLGDGYNGWPEAAPFDGIIVTCAPELVPTPLAAQLKTGGRLLIPVGPPDAQELFVFQKQKDDLVELSQLAVRFVPMTGRAEHSGLVT